MATKVELEKENEGLKSELKTMSDEIAELKKMMQSYAKSQKTSTELDDALSKKSSGKIDGDADITVVSLCLGTLSISTDGLGKGSLYEFSEFGEEQDIPFSELREIVKNNKNFATGVVFGIKDKDAIKQLHLTTHYNNALSINDMLTIMECSHDEFMKRLDKASKYQKENIVRMLCDAKIKGKSIDANILADVGGLINKDLLNLD